MHIYKIKIKFLHEKVFMRTPYLKLLSLYYQSFRCIPNINRKELIFHCTKNFFYYKIMSEYINDKKRDVRTDGIEQLTTNKKAKIDTSVDGTNQINKEEDFEKVESFINKTKYAENKEKEVNNISDEATNDDNSEKPQSETLVQLVKQPEEEKEKTKEKIKEKGKVKTVVTWNVNSITVRYRNKQLWKEFMNFFQSVNADVFCFQEVRLPAKEIGTATKKADIPRDRSKVKNSDTKSIVDYDTMNEILKNDFKDYNAYFSLANIKYSGQLMLIRKNIEVKSIRFNLAFDTNPNIHNEEGRIILAEFEDFFLLTTYSPNNGFEIPKFQRRSRFDEQLMKFAKALKEQNKTLIWTGDLNIAPEDSDLSHPAEFRRMKKGNVPKENVGQPGCTDAERRNFQQILNEGDLVDSWRYFQNEIKKKEKEENGSQQTEQYKNGTPNFNIINENIYTWRCAFNIGTRHNKAMRIDHFVISKHLLPKVEKVEIHGYGVDHKNFYGSDHCPVILKLKDT